MVKRTEKTAEKFPGPGIVYPMTKAEILKELPNLTKAEPEEIQKVLTKLNDEEWLDPDLTDDDKSLLNERIADYRKNPEGGSPWEEVDKRLLAMLTEIELERKNGKRVFGSLLIAVIHSARSDAAWKDRV